MGRVGEYYDLLNAKASAFKTSEKILLFCTVLFCVPIFFYFLVFPYQESSVKSLRSACAAVRARHSVLSSEDEAAKSSEEGIKRNESKIAEMEGLVLGNDSAIQMLNVISNMVEKHSLDIKFTRKNPQFDRIYEKSYVPKGSDGQPDEASRFSYKMLPVEIGFRSTSADFLTFMNILEGFRRLNFSLRRVSAVRTDDGKVDATVIIEFLVDIKFS